jgi:hypothetical protein
MALKQSLTDSLEGDVVKLSVLVDEYVFTLFILDVYESC